MGWLEKSVPMGKFISLFNKINDPKDNNYSEVEVATRRSKSVNQLNLTPLVLTSWTITLVIASIFLPAYANPTLDGTVSNTQVGNALQGPGISISGLSVITGIGSQYGVFTGGASSVTPGPQIGIETGVFLTTSRANATGVLDGETGSNIANAVKGSNNVAGVSDVIGTTYSDAQLTSIDSNAIYDPIILKMQATPVGNFLKITFVFASDEYPEFVCTVFNDAFGMFIKDTSLPDVPANWTNIGVIPGTSTPIAVNTINNGICGSYQASFPAPATLTNSQYYVNNGTGSTPVNNTNLQYDGFTIPFTVEAAVTAGVTYDVKIAIADSGDAYWDGALFVKWVSSSDFADDVDLELNLQADNVSPNTGDTVKFTLTVDNKGQDAATLIQASFSLPAGFTHVSDTSGGNYNSSTGIWTIPGSLAAVTGTTSIEITTTAGGSGAVNAFAEISTVNANDIDSTPANGTQSPVEDDEDTIVLTLPAASLDYGDAPTSGIAPDGSSTNAYGEASHTIVSGTYLGAGDPDMDSANQPTTNADGDDNDGINDEDGVSAFPTLTVGDSSYTLPASNISAAGTGTLHAWIDFDGNGSFTNTEHASTAVTAGVLAGDLSWTGQTTMSAGTTFARFRFTSDASVTASTPSSAATDGEVEDHTVTISGASAEVYTPQGSCGVAGFSETFGAGIGRAPMPGSITTTYIYNDGVGAGGAPEIQDGQYALIDKSSISGAGSWWIVDDDVTGDVNGRMLMLNADHLGGEFYRQSLTGLTVGKNYSFVAHIANPYNDGDDQDPNVKFSVESGGSELASVTTGEIPEDVGFDEIIWMPFTLTFTATSTNVDIVLKDEAPDLGVNSGNDLVIDGITLAETCFLDYGDAPITGTAPDGTSTNAYGEASHTIVSGNYLGASNPDADSTNQPTANADGDDTDGSDDEDGIAIPALTQGATASITATVVGTGGYLQGWIDWNGDGDFSDTGEDVATNIQDNLVGDTDNTVGTIAFNVSVPAGAITNQTYARFRWSSINGLDSTTAASDGEVEDYQVSIEYPITTNAITQCSAGNIPPQLIEYRFPDSDEGGVKNDPASFVNVNDTRHFTNVAIVNGRQVDATLTIDEINSTAPVGQQIQVFYAGAVYVRVEQGAGKSPDNHVKYHIDFVHANDGSPAAYNFAYQGIDIDGFIDDTEREEYMRFYNADYAETMVSNPTNLIEVSGGNYREYRGTAKQNSEPESAAIAIFNNKSTINLMAGQRQTKGGAGFKMNFERSDFSLPFCNGYDYGDALGYTTTGATAARHGVIDTLYIGGNVDIDNGAQEDATALRDDESGIVNTSTRDDEDGISSFAALTTADTSYSLSVVVTNNTGSTANLVGWIDVDDNGVFDTDEASVVTAVPSGTTASSVALNWTSLPTDIQVHESYLRVRLTTDALSAAEAGGEKSDGEVEDYAITISTSAGTFGAKVGQCAHSNSTTTSSISGVSDGGIEIYSAVTANSATVNGITMTRTHIGGPVANTSGESVGLSSLGHTNAGQTMWKLGGGIYTAVIDFNTAIDSNYLIGFNDVDLGATAVITAYDSGGAQISTAAWSYELGNNGVGNTVTIGAADITIFGNNVNNSDPISFIRPQPGQYVNSIQIALSGDPGYSNVYIGHIGCDDNGDAPTSYGSSEHYLAMGSSLQLGTIAGDPEPSTQPTANADGDDTDGTDDEDGISIFPILNDLDTSYSLDVAVTNDTGNTANLVGWIDFDGDGVFATDEAATVVVADGSNNATVQLVWTVPADIQSGDVFVRLRLTTDTTIATGTASTSVATGAANDGEVEDYPITIIVGGFPVKGQIYKDTNVDGINDASEAGISGLPVVLYDVTNDSCISIRTDADGNYTFFPVIPGDYQVYEASRETVPTPQNCGVANAKDPTGYRSTTSNVLVQFSVVDAEITGKDFGDVKAPTFAPDHSGTVLAGNVEFYAHKFTAKSTSVVNFTSSNSGGATAGWSSVIYQDMDCNGQLDGVDGSTPVTSNLATIEGQEICLINKVYAPAAVSAGETFTNVISADFDFNGNALAGTTTLNVTDLSRAAANDPILGSSKLELRKTVQNITQSTAETDTQNQAKPGDVLQYRIYYSNTGTGGLTDLKINDVVPAFTVLNGLPVCETPLPASLTSCTPSVNGDDIEWVFPVSDQLKAGSQGIVSYKVTIE